MLNLADGMEPGTQQKFDSELAYLKVQWFKHFQLWTGPYSFFCSERYETKEGRIKPVKFDYLYCSASKSFRNSKYASLQFYDSSRVFHE